MQLILFVTELGSGFGHVRRLMPIARAAVAAGHRVQFLLGNPREAAAVVNSPEFELGELPQLGRVGRDIRPPGVTAKSYGDILGGCGFCDPDFLRTACRAWHSRLDALRPLAVICEHSPFLSLACFGTAIPLLSVGHGFILPPPHLDRFPALLRGDVLFPEELLLRNVAGVCRAEGRPEPSALPMLLAGSDHAVTGLDILDPYRYLRRGRAVGPPGIDVDLADARVDPTEDIFAYLLGNSQSTVGILRCLAASGLRGRVFVRRGTQAQRDVLVGSRICWLELPEASREALARARLIIHHGSMLTAEEALVAGRPQLIVPLYLEHLVTSKMLRELGVAEVIRAPLDAAQVATRLASAYEDLQMRERAQALACDFRHIETHSTILPSDLLGRILPSIQSGSNPAAAVATRAPAQDSNRTDARLISIVIPSFQMAAHLELTIQSLSCLRHRAMDICEVIVVDDGSTDETRVVFESARRRAPDLQFRYVYRARDRLSCRSLARNIGANASAGRYLLFLDAGVMAHPDMLDVVSQRWLYTPGAEEEVLTLGALGLFAHQSSTVMGPSQSRLRAADEQGLRTEFELLVRDPAWREHRQPWFDLTEGNLSRLPAPWLLAWSCALGVPRRLFAAVGGFDESFINWGAEDCDFALRLHHAGARFRAFPSPAALHVPHPTGGRASRKAQHLENAWRMHVKRFGRESELFVVLEDPFAANRLAMRLDQVPIERLVPPWDERTPEVVRGILGRSEGALVVAAPTPMLLCCLPGATWAVPNQQLFESLGHALGTDAAKLTLFCHCNEPDMNRHAVILTDLLRLLPPPVQIAQLREAIRVGRRAYLFAVDVATSKSDESALPCNLAGWSMTSLDVLSGIAASVGLHLAEIPTAHAKLHAYTISPAN